MNHADLLALLLPSGPYDPAATALAAELDAEGAALDAALSSSGAIGGAIPFLFGDVALLADWERLLAITPAAGASTAVRQAMVLARLRATGGLTLAYFKAVLEAAGYQVFLDEPRGFFAGMQCAGDRLYLPTAVIWYWRIRIRLAGQVIDLATHSVLAAWLAEIKPAFSHFDIED